MKPIIRTAHLQKRSKQKSFIYITLPLNNALNIKPKDEVGIVLVDIKGENATVEQKRLEEY